MAAVKPSFTFTRERDGAHERWTVVDALGKLALRGRLPGAFGFDRATEALNRARAAGVAIGDLLPLAFPASWLVNSAIPSPVLAKWQLPPFVGYFRTLIAQLETGPHALADLDEARLTSTVTPLGIDGQGAGAISKVVASLVPGAMVLMPDAALAFAIGAPPLPETPDVQTAGAAAFAPMLKWFAGEVATHEAELNDLAARDARARAPAKQLTAAQLLDRLIWFESAGYRAMRGGIVSGGAFACVTSGAGDARRQAVVHIPAVREPPLEKGVETIDLEVEPDSVWKAAAQKALADAF
ncbi:MAG: hypothetical protein ABI551_04120 [Polyangiaceae bacterium]